MFPTKICRTCKKEQAESVFYLRCDPKTGHTRREKICNNCKAAERQKYVDRNPEKAKAWKQTSREKAPWHQRTLERQALSAQGLKKCTKCQQVKSLEDFYVNKRSAEGRLTECRACRAIYYIDHVKHDETRKTRAAESRQKSRRRKLYGITLNDYQALLAVHNGGCWICGSTTTSKHHKYLSVDHDHATGKVRGVLCANCNHGLGSFKDNPDRLRRAAEYLEAANVNPEG
jgi:hypothetical protein